MLEKIKEVLAVRWEALWHRLSVNSKPEESFFMVAELYSKPDRFYHTLDHIASCLQEFDDVRLSAENPDAVELALWLHDVIYDTRAKDNEEKSAEFAGILCRDAKLPEEFIGLVQRLIRSTKSHIPSSPDEALLIDIDLSILAMQSIVFDAYEYFIRKDMHGFRKKSFAKDV